MAERKRRGPRHADDAAVVERVGAMMAMQTDPVLKTFARLWMDFVDRSGSDVIEVRAEYEVSNAEGTWRVVPPTYMDLRARLEGMRDDASIDSSVLEAVNDAMVKTRGVAYDGRVVVKLPVIELVGPPAVALAGRPTRPRRR